METKNRIGLSVGLCVIATCAGCVTTGLSTREQPDHFADLMFSRYQEGGTAETNRPVTPPIRVALAQIGEPAPEAIFVKRLSRDPRLIERVSSLPMPGDQTTRYVREEGLARTREAMAAQVDSARSLARGMGAQYLLLTGGSVESYVSHNFLSALDITVIGGLLLPGSAVNMQGKAAGALIDAATGDIMMLQNVELKRRNLTPTFHADDTRDEMGATMREEALEQLAESFLTELGKSASAPTGQR